MIYIHPRKADSHHEETCLTRYFFLVLLIGSFLGGAWYSQHGTGKNSEKKRRILHYVDPMNPVNVSDKPGIAPCGMPMEPVYGDDESTGSSPPGRRVLSMSPGTVMITPQKQQIIGIQVGAVERTPGTYEVRTLGRITLDENRIYPLITATDGWAEDIQGSTTGSLVKKDQLMALIKIYDYDFFTWQQRYLAELANRGLRRHPTTPTEARQLEPIRAPQTVTAAPETLPPPEEALPAIKKGTVPQQGAPPAGMPLFGSHQCQSPSQKKLNHLKECRVPERSIQLHNKGPDLPVCHRPESNKQKFSKTDEPQPETVQPEKSTTGSSLWV